MKTENIPFELYHIFMYHDIWYDSVQYGKSIFCIIIWYKQKLIFKLQNNLGNNIILIFASKIIMDIQVMIKISIISRQRSELAHAHVSLEMLTQ